MSAGEARDDCSVLRCECCLRERHESLIAANVRWLSQALALAGAIDDATFATSPANFAPHNVGAHLRPPPRGAPVP